MQHPQLIPQLAEIARRIAALTVTKGGATWNLVDGDLSGQQMFAVSVFPERALVTSLNTALEEPDTDLAPEVEEFIRANKSILIDDPRVSIGTWVSDGDVYLDLSITVPNLLDALCLGAQHGQQAIYDLARQVEIPVPAARESAA